MKKLKKLLMNGKEIKRKIKSSHLQKINKYLLYIYNFLFISYLIFKDENKDIIR